MHFFSFTQGSCSAGRSCWGFSELLTILAIVAICSSGCRNQRTILVEMRNTKGQPVAGSVTANNVSYSDSASSSIQLPCPYRDQEVVTISARVGGQAQYRQLRISADTSPRVVFTFDVERVPRITSVSPVRWDSVPIGTWRKSLVAVGNAGDAPLVIERLSILGPSASQFHVNRSQRFQVDPGNQLSVEIRFIPTEPGEKEAELVIESNSEKQSVYRVPLKGWGAPAQPPGTLRPLLVSVSEIDLGSVSVVESNTSQCLIRNTGDAPLVVRRLSVAGPGASQYVVVSNQGFRVDPGEEHTIDIRFSPTTEGEKLAELLVESNTESQRIYRITLRGKGTPAHSIDISQLYKFGGEQFDAYRYEDAEQTFSQILKAEPAEPLALYNRGRARLALKKYELAIDDLERIRMYRSRISHDDFDRVWYESWYFIARAAYEKYKERVNPPGGGRTEVNTTTKRHELDDLKKVALRTIDDFLTLGKGDPVHINHALAWRKDLNSQ